MRAFILGLIMLSPNHELNRYDSLLDLVVENFEAAGEKYNLEPSLLAYWAFRESSLRVDVVGRLGEVGYAQVHGKARRTCEAAGLQVDSRYGGAHCIGLLLDMGRRYCGDLYHGAIWYASGSCRGSTKTREKIKQRLVAWERRWENR